MLPGYCGPACTCLSGVPSSASAETHRLYHDYLPLPSCPLRRYLSPMLTHIVCSSCGHAGATDSARLPRILTCARCGHRALFEAKPSKRLAQGQQRHTAKRRLAGQAHEIGRLVRSQVPA
jgi:DNA-directed RNA polymerase subunit RPC12/RpoP